MRILFLTQVLPYPLDAGPKLRAYYVLRALAARHEVVLVSFTRAEDTPDHIAHLRLFCAAVYTTPMERSAPRTLRAALQAVPRGQPVVIARDAIDAMYALIAGVLAAGAPFDAVHADQTSMVQYALWAADRQQPRPRLVLDAHNALYQVFARLAVQTANPLRRRVLAWEARRLARYEATAYARFDEVVFVTAVDRARFDLARAHVIPICVEPDAAPLHVADAVQAQVLFVGTLFWPPNAEGAAWFLKEVWPRVLDRAPHARFVAAGKRPPAALRRLAQQTAHAELAGYVDDLTALVRGSAVFVVPLHAGGGMRVKIVDAWNWGLPVVTTTVGAEGLEYTAGTHLLVADDATAFADAIVRLLTDRTLSARLAAAGRTWVAARYDWRRVYTAWEAVYTPASPPCPAEPVRAVGEGAVYDA